MKVIHSLVLLAIPLGLNSRAGAHEITPTFTSKNYGIVFPTGLVRTKQSEEYLKRAPRVSFTKLRTEVPGQASLRGQLGPVEDQGSCASCWAFALTTALRGTLMAAGTDPGRLSFNYLINCNTSGYGCRGGDFPAAEYLTQPKGPPSYGQDGTYTGHGGACIPLAPVASAGSFTLLGPDLASRPKSPSPSFKDIAYVVGVLGRPVVADVLVDINWMHYSKGTFNWCAHGNMFSVNHMVVIEGYDCESAVDQKGNCKFNSKGNLPPGVGRWIVRNSYGVNWGDNGYITIKATGIDGSRCNSIATDALFFSNVPGSFL